jgi:hypothetical protein
MIIGKITKNEKMIRFNEKIICNNCRKQVPGGLKTGEVYFKTESFKTELENFKKLYLCGICRDKKRIENNNQKLN